MPAQGRTLCATSFDNPPEIDFSITTSLVKCSDVDGIENNRNLSVTAW